MGNWNISIHGVGSHHNKDYERDADRMAARFVEDLKRAGHSVSKATITHGAESDITDGAAYEEQRQPKQRQDG